MFDEQNSAESSPSDAVPDLNAKESVQPHTRFRIPKFKSRGFSSQRKKLFSGFFAIILTVAGLSTALLLTRGSLDLRQRATGQMCVCNSIEDTSCGCPAGQSCSATSLSVSGYCSGGGGGPQLPTPTPVPPQLPTPTPVPPQLPTPVSMPLTSGAAISFSSTAALLEAQNVTNYAINAGRVSPISAAEQLKKLQEEMTRLNGQTEAQINILIQLRDYSERILKSIPSGRGNVDDRQPVCGIRYVLTPDKAVVGKVVNIEAEVFSSTIALDGAGMFRLNGADVSDVKKGRLDGSDPEGRWFHAREISVRKSGENVVLFGLTNSTPPRLCNESFFDALPKPSCSISVNGKEVADNGGNDAQAQTITVPEGSTVTLEANGVGTLGTGVFVSPINAQNWTRQDGAGQKAVLQWRAVRSGGQDTFFVTCNNKWAPGTKDYVCTGNPFSKGGVTPGFGHDCGGKDLVRIKVNPLPTPTPTPVTPPTTGTPVTPPSTGTLPVQRINFLNLRGLVRLQPSRSFVLSGAMSAPVPVNEWIYELSTTANFSSNVERVSQKPKPVREVNSFLLTRTLSSTFRIACEQRIYWRVSAVTAQGVRLQTPVQSTNVVCQSGVR